MRYLIVTSLNVEYDHIQQQKVKLRANLSTAVPN